MNLICAIQKSGRLHEGSVKLLKECGLVISNGNNQLRIVAENFPLEIYFLRDDDIPEYVADGVADIGIVGENILLEKNKQTVMLEKLGFGKCRLAIAIPKNEVDESLNGKRIATSYPFLLSKYLSEQKISATIHEISGSVEISPKIGLADAICDLVSSGSTLFSNELQETEVILRSEAALISGRELDSDKRAILEKLLFRIRAVKRAKNNKYVLLNAPNHKVEKICALLPGMKSPTVLPLAETGWSSVHSVISEDDFWNVIEKLKIAGAEGILILPIEKMIA